MAEDDRNDPKDQAPRPPEGRLGLHLRPRRVQPRAHPQSRAGDRMTLGVGSGPSGPAGRTKGRGWTDSSPLSAPDPLRPEGKWLAWSVLQHPANPAQDT